MLARLLRAALLLELALVTAAFHYAAGRDWPTAFVFALLVAVAIPSVLMLMSFALAWARRMQRAPSMSIGPLRAVRMVAQEILTTLILYRVMQPLGRRAMSDALTVSSPESRHNPVLLIHGFLSNSAYWWFLRRRLAKAEITDTYVIDLEPVLGDIDDYVRPISERIEEICAQTRSQRVLLVGHSMGGLAARAYLRDHSSQDRVAGPVDLGYPSSRHRSR